MRGSPLAALLWLLAIACSASGPAVPEALSVLSPELQAIRIQNLSVPRPGLLASGQPTAVQLEQLARLGVRKLITLRAPDEADTGWEPGAASASGMHFVRLPIRGAADLTPDAAQRLAAELAAAGGPALVACGSGNRVGALLALMAFHVDGRPAAEALEFGRAAGLGALEQQVVERLR